MMKHCKQTDWLGGMRRPIPFFLAAVSVCDIQAFTENRFAKKGQKNQKTSGEP